MDGIYGFISNVSSICITHPIVVVKTNFQLNNSKSAVDTIKTIYTTRGPTGFYSGIVPTLMAYPIFWSVYFGANQITNEHMRLAQNNYANNFLTSCTNSMVGSILANPFFVIATRMQNTARGKLSFIQSIRDINKNNNARAYFKGINSTLFNNGKLALQFPLYDCIKDYSGSVFVASTSSKLISSTIFYPFDLIRTIQRNSDTKMSVLTVGKQLFAQRQMYKGVMLYNAVSTPNFVVMMLIFEFLKKA